MYLNEVLFMDERNYTTPVKGCARTHIKFEIYRPGSNFDILKTSIVDFDEIQIKELKVP